MIGASALRTLLAAAVMGMAVWAAAYRAAPMVFAPGRGLYAAQLFGGVAIGAAVFFAAARLLGLTELGDLLRRGPRPSPVPAGVPPLENDPPA